MPKYKFTRVYEVEAPTQTEAFEKCRSNLGEYLRYESSGLVPEQRKTWGQSLKKQIAGK